MAITNPENTEQFIVMPGTHVIHIKESLLRRYYLKSLIYTDGAGYRQELMLQRILDEGRPDNGDIVFCLIKE